MTPKDGIVSSYNVDYLRGSSYDDDYEHCAEWSRTPFKFQPVSETQIPLSNACLLKCHSGCLLLYLICHSIQHLRPTHKRQWLIKLHRKIQIANSLEDAIVVKENWHSFKEEITALLPIMSRFLWSWSAFFPSMAETSIFLSNDTIRREEERFPKVLSAAG